MKRRHLLFITLVLVTVLLFGLLVEGARGSGEKWAVLVGINDYQNTELNRLDFAVQDVKAVKSVLMKYGGFQEDNILIYTSDQKGGYSSPTATNIITGLESMTNLVKPRDTFIFHFSGHGLTQENESFLLTCDADPRSMTTLKKTSLSISEVRSVLERIRAAKILLVMDACRNDPVKGRGSGNNLMSDKFSRSVIIRPKGGSAEGGVQVAATLFSCEVGQRSYEWPDKKQGFFSYYLCQGLKGAAAVNGKVTLTSLVDYLDQKVPVACRKVGKPEQMPWAEIQGHGQSRWVLAWAKKGQADAGSEAVANVEPQSSEEPAASRPQQVAMGTLPSVITNSKDGSELIMIPAGEFLMGSNDYDSEKPPHRVYLSAYYIGKYEVTNEQFAKFVNETDYNAGGDWKKYYNSGTADHPVVCVSWNDAAAYCRWAGLRLPTEAEWEKAARGTDGRKYPWGNEWDAERCNWFQGPSLSGMANIYRGRGTLSVGSFSSGASPYGCLDMAGNVWEWCNDWYGEKYYSQSPSSDPQGPSSGSDRILRGGSWNYDLTNYLRCAYRYWFYPDGRSYSFGFRVVRPLNTR